MLKLVEKPQIKKRTPIDWQPLIQECLKLLESRQAKSKSEAAWMVARNHRDEGISCNTLRDYFCMWQRFHVEPIREQKETVGLNPGARGNPRGQGAKIVRSQNGTTQPTLAAAGIDKKLSSRTRKKTFG